MNATGNTPEPGPAASLLTGCLDYATAIRNAEAMRRARRGAVAGDLPDRDDQFWDSATAQSLGCYLHAAAVRGLSASSVRAWLAGPAHRTTAAEILATHPGAARQAAATVRTFLHPTPSKTAEVIRYMAAEAFAHATGHRLS